MRAVRISLAAAATLAIVGVGLPAHAATTATPAGSCTVAVSLPSKLVISSWNTVVTADLQDPAGCAKVSAWSLVKGTQDASAMASFGAPNTVDHVAFYTGPSGNHAGTYTAVGSTAYSEQTFLDADGSTETVEVVQQDGGPMVAKYGSKLSWISAVRSGGTVTLAARAVRYSPFATVGGSVTWKKAAVLVQKKIGTTWHTVKTVHTDAKGVVSARVAGAKRAWRLVTADSSTVWGTATSAKRR
jgi:hypothetical protein